MQFSPALPDKVAAAAGLPLGNAEKVMLALDEPELFPVDGHMFGATNRVATGSYDLRPLGQPCVEAFFGGSLARELARSDMLADFAVEELIALIGSDFRDKVHPLAASAWTRDRFARGSYSYALPAAPVFARCSQSRWTGGSFSRARLPPQTSFRPPMARTNRAFGRLPKWHERSDCSPIGPLRRDSESVRSSRPPKADSRCRRERSPESRVSSPRDCGMAVFG